MRYQTYVLHLIDGTAIPMAEDYDLPAEKDCGPLLQSGSRRDFYRGRPAAGLCYIPKSSIVYLETGDVIVR